MQIYPEQCQFFSECRAKMRETSGAGASAQDVLDELTTECYPCASHGGLMPLADRQGCFDCGLDKPCPEQLVHAVNYNRGCHLKPKH